MKKLLLFVVAAISFASCSGSGSDSNQATSGADAVPAAVVEEVEAIISDSVDGDTAIVDEIGVEVAE